MQNFDLQGNICHRSGVPSDRIKKIKNKQMKHCLLIFSVLLVTIMDASAQQTKTKFMQITTIESVVGGGMGRSKIIITKEDGSQEEKKLDNLFSMAGINFKNIENNERDILETLKSYTGQGWKLVSTVPLTLSPGQGGSGIFMTRYLFTREE